MFDIPLFRFISDRDKIGQGVAQGTLSRTPGRPKAGPPH
jgi:hypothetical protein